MLLSRSMLYAAAFSSALHIGLLGIAAGILVTQGRVASAPLKVSLLQSAAPLPVGDLNGPEAGVQPEEKPPAPAPPSPLKPQPKPKMLKPRAIAPPTPKVKKPRPAKKIVAPALVTAPHQPAPLPLPTLQEGVTGGSSAGENPTEKQDQKDGGGNTATVTQEAKATSGGGGFSAQPDYSVNPKPPYPVIARRTGTQGVVLLRVQVRVDGTVAEVQIAQSSGSALLDDSALQTVRDSWRFIPARLDGVPVESWVEVPIRFILGDS